MGAGDDTLVVGAGVSAGVSTVADGGRGADRLVTGGGDDTL